MKTLVIVPARMGSKGIAGKNARFVKGKTLTEWACLQGVRIAEEPTDVVISTDEPKVFLDTSVRLGINLLKRPEELSGDLVIDQPVLQHALDEMELSRGVKYSTVIMLQPTSPCRPLAELKAGLTLHVESASSATWSVSPVPIKFHHLKQIWQDSPGARLGSPTPMPRQQLLPTYIRNGAFYIISRAAIEDVSLAGSNLGMYISKEVGPNIDSLADLTAARRNLQVVGGELRLRSKVNE